MSKEISMKKSSRMSIVRSHAAGVDIGAKFHVVAVPPDADAEPVRTFQSFTGDLHRMSDWLKTCHITTVAMESTSIYWLPAFEILEAAGFNVILVNARDAKMFPVARLMSTTHSGYRNCIHLVFFGPVSDLYTTFPYSGLI
jgi:hypothetical protein